MNSVGYAKTLRALAAVPSQVAADVAEKLTARLQSQFDAGAGPYGDGWAPLAKGGASHLDDTGAMRGGTKAQPMGGSGVALVAPSPADFHQSGTSRMPARKVLPDNGLPAAWRADIQEAFAERLAKAVGK